MQPAMKFGWVIAALSVQSCAVAFSFSFSNTAPRTCETIVVEWRGGEPPFSLTLMVSDHV